MSLRACGEGDLRPHSVCALAALLFFVQAAAAQSELNFPVAMRGVNSPGAVSVFNPSPYYADLKIALYASDGVLRRSAANPVAYRIPPRSRFAMSPAEIFGTSAPAGWIQATSSTSGLQGLSFSSDGRGGVESEESSQGLLDQVIPLKDAGSGATILLTNPGSDEARFTVIFYNERGVQIGRAADWIAPHAQRSVRALGASARVYADARVVATAVVERPASVVFVGGQAVDQLAAARIVPHFVGGNGLNSTLILTNPTNSPVQVDIRLYNNAGAPAALTPAAQWRMTIPANGSASADAALITGSASGPVPVVDGWLRIDSPNAALNGLVIVESDRAATVIPVQSTPLERFVLTIPGADDPSATLALLHTAQGARASVNVTLSWPDGATAAQQTVQLSPNTRWSLRLSRLFRETAALSDGLITIRSSVPLYGMAWIGGPGSPVVSAINPQTLTPAYALEPSVAAPRILRIEPGADVTPGMRVQVHAANVGAGDGVSFVFGEQTAPALLISSGGDAVFQVEVPRIEPGFVNMKLRRDGIDSNAAWLRVLDADGLLTETLEGRAFYQKPEVTDTGWDSSQRVMTPVRRARVEVVDRATQRVISVSETDNHGYFRALAPKGSDLTVRVLSRLRGLHLRVADNTSGARLYGISQEIDMREPPQRLWLIAGSQASGAFNILEAVQRGNDLLALADRRITPPPVTMYWSVRNTNRSGAVQDGFVGTTFFSLSGATAFILGDPNADPDEFDDSVILHEYAHMLAVRFSKDDSPGASHGVGDVLDPRVAWSEGFANFFSSAARNDPIYRDAKGFNGGKTLRYDLEENVPPGDRPGYWSEASVHSLLWDLFDDAADAGDEVRFSFSSLWEAFADLRNDYFVYLPYFLERFLARNPESTDVVRSMVQLRSIDFQPGVRPSVTNPFPRPIAFGQTAAGEVNSLTTRRTNLSQSAHFFSFTTSGGPATIRMDIEGLGRGNNPAANDLDLYLRDLTGRVIAKSDRGLSGQFESISRVLSEGSYIIEVRSFSTPSQGKGGAFNSGRYRLSLQAQ